MTKRYYFSENATAMGKETHQKFVLLHEQEQLLAPKEPASTVAQLMLKDIDDSYRRMLSGQFLNWTDQTLLDQLQRQNLKTPIDQ